MTVDIIEDLERLVEELTDDREPCCEDDCGKEAVAALVADCGKRSPLCLEHRDMWAEWLENEGHKPIVCGSFRGRTDEHWHLAPL
jgi:hypothetical protein